MDLMEVTTIAPTCGRGEGAENSRILTRKAFYKKNM